MEIEKVKKPKIQVNTTLDMDLWTFAREHNIPWNELLEFAIKFKIAEVEGLEYPKNSLSDKLARAMQKLSEVSQELYDLKENKSLKQKETSLEEEVDEILRNELEKQ